MDEESGSNLGRDDVFEGTTASSDWGDRGKFRDSLLHKAAQLEIGLREIL